MYSNDKLLQSVLSGAREGGAGPEDRLPSERFRSARRGGNRNAPLYRSMSLQNSRGVMPVTFLKLRLKVTTSLYPTFMLTS